ncbi:hypothetical protein, partial [Nocardioides sp.]|uniref:hypothetical protein n=1 Tax=Nocardioides sp. TaxID=35761 RepID=UPI002732BC42
MSASLALSFPRVPRRLVPRPRLLRRLDRLADVTIIEALPGYGKRTLTGSWVTGLQRAGTRVVWVRATADVDGPDPFLSLLHRALQHAGLLGGPVPTPRPAESELPGWVRQLTRSAVPIVVVVEHAQLLRDSAVTDVLARLVRMVHPLHLVVLAECGQGFQAAAARHGLETNVLRADDLAITPDELVRYAEAWGHQLSTDTAHLLHELVGGWLLPMRLVLDATPAWADELATHAADEFLHQQVLAHLDEDQTLAAALPLAVPERLTITLAAAALAEEGPAGASDHPVIEAMNCRGLIWRVPRQNGEAEWQMPALVRRVLLGELGRRDPDLQRSAHRQVARALAATSDGAARRELLRHARAAEDWAALARLWSHEGWPMLEGEPEGFSVAFTAIPSEAHDQHPVLMLAESLADALHATTDEESRVETLLRHYMRVGSAFLEHPAGVEDHGQLAHLLTAGMVVRRTEGRLDDARRLAAEADHHFARARAAQSRHLGPEHSAWLHLQWSLVELQDGRLGPALHRAVTGHEIAPRGVVGASCAGLVAALHALGGEAQEAGKWLESHDASDLHHHWCYALAGL